MWRTVFLCCIGLVTVFGSRGSDWGPPPAAHTVPTDSEEIALGAALAARFDADRGILPSPEAQRIEAYLQHIADSLGAHTRRRLPWRIHFDPHPGIKSGFALPGGHIVIWGGILSYMSTEDEAAAVIAHEIEHIDLGQVSRRIDSLSRTQHRDVRTPAQWNWDEFGASYGETLENLCDYQGAKLAVAAGYSPYGYKLILESFVALGKVHSPDKPPPKAITDRITQIEHEIEAEHWQARTSTRPLRLPGNGDEPVARQQILRRFAPQDDRGVASLLRMTGESLRSSG